MKRAAIWNLMFVLICCLFSNCTGQMNDAGVRQPAVAGKFYPADPVKLKSALNYFFEDAVKQQQRLKPLGIIVPHAGYIYSGRIAADAFNQAKNFEYDVVVILGTNHTTAGFDKVSVYPNGAYSTPLGSAVVDEGITGALLKEDSDCVTDLRPQETEHSVEVQVPFVQYLFPKARIVPIVVGTPDVDLCSKLGKALAKILKEKNVLIVASSDLSHYPAYDDAVITDKNTLDVIATMNTKDISKKLDAQMHSGVRSLVTCACGEAPILAMITAVKELGGNYASVISYANSGNTLIGTDDRVVGYGAVAFYRTGKDKPVISVNKMDTLMNAASELSVQDKVNLLKLARLTIEQYLNSETLPLLSELTPAMKQRRGAFVTLRKNKELRGCIGTMSDELQLFNVIGRMALSAALNDNRFQPLEVSELPVTEIEISVLTPPVKVSSDADIVLGRDGIILKNKGKQAVFLPQVATETGWGKEKFLTQLCFKAGLSANDWKTATLFTFRAEVFSEADFK